MFQHPSSQVWIKLQKLAPSSAPEESLDLLDPRTLLTYGQWFVLRSVPGSLSDFSIREVNKKSPLLSLSPGCHSSSVSSWTLLFQNRDFSVWSTWSPSLLRGWCRCC
ncbi:hypothetical protein F7725_015637 [Dissostichus mawsoni]|uniref:Uncharacterized protein n=1 Tax=Dissostichus mawsoni TaxID=36200 RepID=A0A7J5YIC3_DISMA|nr:hypothetical protein F7725_015637 [Dissostichus mawsoni]